MYLYSMFDTPEAWWLEVVVCAFYLMFLVEAVVDVRRQGWTRYASVSEHGHGFIGCRCP